MKLSAVIYTVCQLSLNPLESSICLLIDLAVEEEKVCMYLNCSLKTIQRAPSSGTCPQQRECSGEMRFSVQTILMKFTCMVGRVLW